MQRLNHAGEWVDSPDLITSMHEPGKYEPVTEEQAHAAAVAAGADWN